MAAAGYISTRETYDDSFANELIKMSQAHYKRQGARVTKAVKIAQMGRIMARQSELEKLAELYQYGNLTDDELELVKEALSSAGVGKFLTNLMGKGSNVVGRAAGAVNRGAGKLTSQVSQMQSNRALAATQKAVQKATQKGSKVVGKVNIPMPTTTAATQNMAQRTSQVAQKGGDILSNISKTTPAPKVGPLARGPAKLVGPQMKTPAGAVQKPGFMKNFFGNAAGAVNRGADKLTSGATNLRSTVGSIGVPKPGHSQFVGPQLPKSPQPQQGFLKKFYGGAKGQAENLAVGLRMGGGGPGAGFVQRVGGHAKDLGTAAMGGDTGSLVKNIAGQAVVAPAAMGAAGAVWQGAKRLAGSRGVVKNVMKRGKGAVGDISQAAFHAPGVDDAARKLMMSKGMSGRQMSAVNELFEQGPQMSRGARKKLERIAGVKYDDITRHGGLNPALEAVGRGEAGSVKKLKEVKDLAGDAAEQVGELYNPEPADIGAAAPGMVGKVKNFFTQPLGGPKTRLALGAAGIAVPVVGGLGAYGAYHGMNALSAANQASQYQHGTMGAPINYSQTAMFPAGQIAY